jgi:hypothetical protein
MKISGTFFGTVELAFYEAFASVSAPSGLHNVNFDINLL